MSPSKSARQRKLKALRDRGWGEAKIQRWLNEQDVVTSREERGDRWRASVWADDKAAGIEKSLIAKYRDSAIIMEPELGFDHPTALALLDDAEAAITAGLHGDDVARATAEAQAIGINAIPAFLLDSRLIVLGAQPDEVFEQAFDQLARA